VQRQRLKHFVHELGGGSRATLRSDSRAEHRLGVNLAPPLVAPSSAFLFPAAHYFNQLRAHFNRRLKKIKGGFE
jgi:hypothetical protein